MLPVGCCAGILSLQVACFARHLVGEGTHWCGSLRCQVTSLPHLPTCHAPFIDMEQEAAAGLAAATEGRYMEPPLAAYRIPTAHYHFQSADALALAPGFRARDGSLLLATFDKQVLA